MGYIMIVLAVLFILFIVCAVRQASLHNDWQAAILTDAASDCLHCLFWIVLVWLDD